MVTSRYIQMLFFELRVKTENSDLFRWGGTTVGNPLPLLSSLRDTNCNFTPKSFAGWTGSYSCEPLFSLGPGLAWTPTQSISRAVRQFWRSAVWEWDVLRMLPRCRGDNRLSITRHASFRSVGVLTGGVENPMLGDGGLVASGQSDVRRNRLVRNSLLLPGPHPLDGVIQPRVRTCEELSNPALTPTLNSGLNNLFNGQKNCIKCRNTRSLYALPC